MWEETKQSVEEGKKKFGMKLNPSAKEFIPSNPAEAVERVVVTDNYRKPNSHGRKNIKYLRRRFDDNIHKWVKVPLPPFRVILLRFREQTSLMVQNIPNRLSFSSCKDGPAFRPRKNGKISFQFEKEYLSREGAQNSLSKSSKHGIRVDVMGLGLTVSILKNWVMLDTFSSHFLLSHRKMLIQLLDKHCEEQNKVILGLSINPPTPLSEYDFVYLPIDFNSNLNRGYAFVNFTTVAGAFRFFRLYDKHKWDLFESKKICEIDFADIQGRENLVEHFMKSNFICDTNAYLPLQFLPPRNGLSQSTIGTVIGRRNVPHQDCLKRGNNRRFAPSKPSLEIRTGLAGRTKLYRNRPPRQFVVVQKPPDLQQKPMVNHPNGLMS